MKKNIHVLCFIMTFLLTGCSIGSVSIDRNTIYYGIAVIIGIILVLSIINNLIKIKGEGSYRPTGNINIQNNNDNFMVENNSLNREEAKIVNDIEDKTVFLGNVEPVGLKNNDVNFGIVNNDINNVNNNTTNQNIDESINDNMINQNVDESFNDNLVSNIDSLETVNNNESLNENTNTNFNGPVINVNSKSVVVDTQRKDE